MKINEWMTVRKSGLYCVPGDFYVDALRPVSRCVITHAHADHARSGHDTVWCTKHTADIMQIRYGENCFAHVHTLAYGQAISISDVTVTLYSAGHILGSAQVLLEYQGVRLLITGDFKRQLDPTCEPFQVVACDYLITEATFGLPVFHHPPIEHELTKLLTSLQNNQDATHLLGCYALGKAQRVIMGLRSLGYNEIIYYHGAMHKLCQYYAQCGFALGPLEPVGRRDKKTLQGALVLAPPSALTDKWSQGFVNKIIAMASGWLSIRARSRQRRVECPLVVSDHADWDDLLATIQAINPQHVFVTHGREDALVYQCKELGFTASALHILRDEEES